MAQNYKIINFQTNNLAEKAKIQGNNSAIKAKIQGNNSVLSCLPVLLPPPFI